MTDPKAREICFDIIAQRRDKLNHVADSMYPSVSFNIIHMKGNLTYTYSYIFQVK